MNAWNLLDLLIVGSDIVFELLSLALGQLPSVAFLRIFRLVRLMRVAHIIVAFPELHMLVQGLVDAARTLWWATILLVIVLTMWSILRNFSPNPIHECM